MKQKNIYSHLTAKEREKLSFPMNWLKRNNYLQGNILDYGCGFGTDVEFLKKEGYDANGYDNYYFKNYPKFKYDTITCIYVLNVLDPVQETDVILSVSELLKHGGKAYFAVRRDIVHEGFRIHKIHKKPTYQSIVKLPFKSVFANDFCEIYEYQHYDIVNNNNDECIFCSPKREVILESVHAYAIFDKFPVSPGHSLVIPKRHVASYFDLTLNEQIACNLTLNKLKSKLDPELRPDGYNVGININESAGQTIGHVHIHLIPRYKNDVPNPIGGVRNIIPGKGDYVTNKDKWKDT